MTIRCVAVSGGAALWLALCAPALAWGPMGHAIVAEIAAREMTPAARRQVEDLIGAPAQRRMADLSSWADWQGRARPLTKPWHYVDIEVGSEGYVAARDCPDGDCIVGAIARQEQVLRDPSAPQAARAEALIWLIHLLGDLHQPLHCADHHDRGGNEETLWVQGRRTNLHAVWDRAPEYLPEAASGDEAAAGALASRITARQRADWQEGSTADWASESFRIARDRIYRPMLAHRDGGWNAPAPQLIAAQLEKAGVRLAALLNRDLP